MHYTFSLIFNLLIGLAVVAQSQPRPCCCLLKVLSEGRAEVATQETGESSSDVVSSDIAMSGSTDSIREALPPCCQNRLPARADSEEETDSSPNPCRCNSQYDQNARVDSDSGQLRMKLLSSLDWVDHLSFHAPASTNLTTVTCRTTCPSPPVFTDPVRAELNIWLC